MPKLGMTAGSRWENYGSVLLVLRCLKWKVGMCGQHGGLAVVKAWQLQHHNNLHQNHHLDDWTNS